MRTRYDVYFNGLGLQDIGPEVIVKDIRHKAPKLTAKAERRTLADAAGAGERGGRRAV